MAKKTILILAFSQFELGTYLGNGKWLNLAEILADNSNLISAQIISIEPQDQHQPIAVACTTGKMHRWSFLFSWWGGCPTNWLLPHQLHGFLH